MNSITYKQNLFVARPRPVFLSCQVYSIIQVKGLLNKISSIMWGILMKTLRATKLTNSSSTGNERQKGNEHLKIKLS